MRKLRVLVIVHPKLVPPENTKGIIVNEMPWRTEHFVINQLKNNGHNVRILPVGSDLKVIRIARDEFKPHIAFNLLECFDDETLFDHNVVSYLELLKLPYTGCNPKGLILSRDKSLCKKIMYYHRIKTPRFDVALMGKKFKRSSKLVFPLIVKSLTEEGSVGISQSSVVDNDEKLQERIRFIHDKALSHALVESYIEGKDVYVSMIGNKRVGQFPILELKFKNAPDNIHQIATSRVKWNSDYRKKHGIDTELVKNFPPELSKKIFTTSRRIYKVLNFSGYARLDLRLTPSGKIFFLEANPNPDIARTEDFAYSAKKAGLDYSMLLDKILKLGLSN
ncbi:MAG: D-alanine--D-alanine ligase [Bacteriovoracaceae bacterium]|nr:D-alanine--D-alanine ligase [Bacteriovoracaceae bacterium]